MLIAANRRIPLVRLLVFAALFHFTISSIVFLIGKTQLLPDTFDTNGTGRSFVIDSVTYREEALKMAGLIQQGELRQWIAYKSRLVSTFHLSFYSLALALFGPFLGYGVMAVEPVNLAYYLLIVFFTYRLGVAVFSWWVGQFAAIAVGVWPSLLLHTTQMLRDPLFICGFLLLINCLVKGLRGTLSNRTVLLNAGGAIVGLGVILLSKANMWEVVAAILVLWTAACLLVQVKVRQWHWLRFCLVFTIVFGAFVLPRVVPHFRLPDVSPSAKTSPASLNQVNSGFAGRLINRISFSRHRFIVRYPHAGSNIDGNVELYGTAELIKYLPRAAEIGFLAPFPTMWFTSGVQVKLGGRLLSGFEMLLAYFCLALALITLFHDRRLEVWFLFATTSAGCLALGYVVINVAAMYRMRYAYFVLLIVLAVRGVQIVTELKHGEPSE